jgi:hypothetical protein
VYSFVKESGNERGYSAHRIIVSTRPRACWSTSCAGGRAVGIAAVEHKYDFLLAVQGGGVGGETCPFDSTQLKRFF